MRENEVSEGTAKHGFNDHRDIGRGKHVALLRAMVDELFSIEYLELRGLDHRDATRHNDLVAQALDVVLAYWDQDAVVANVAPERTAQLGEFRGLATGFSMELLVRLAAYEARYGYLHSFLADVPRWLQAPKLEGWWHDIDDRAGRKIRVSLLKARGELDPHTVSQLRSGKTLPKEGTVRVLAERLAAYAIRDRGADRDAHVAELEVELRVAIAAAENRDLVARFIAPRDEDALIVHFHLLRSVLRALPDQENEVLLRQGTRARSWPRIETSLNALRVARVVEMTRAMMNDVGRRTANREQGEVQEAVDAAATCARLAADLRGLDRRPGADGPEKRVAESLDLQRHVALAFAARGQSQIPTPRPELAAEIKADQLCWEAVDPWTNLSAVEKEQRLREAIRTCDWSAYAHRSLARHLQSSGKVDDALQHLRRAVELNPENEEGREALAAICAERGKYEEALALTEGPTSLTMLRVVRAYALLKLGNAERARESINAVLEVHPRHAPAHWVLAHCLRAAGDERGAREHERKAEFYERGVAPPGASIR